MRAFILRERLVVFDNLVSWRFELVRHLFMKSTQCTSIIFKLVSGVYVSTFGYYVTSLGAVLAVEHARIQLVGVGV